MYNNVAIYRIDSKLLYKTRLLFTIYSNLLYKTRSDFKCVTISLFKNSDINLSDKNQNACDKIDNTKRVLCGGFA